MNLQGEDRLRGSVYLDKIVISEQSKLIQNSSATILIAVEKDEDDKEECMRTRMRVITDYRPLTILAFAYNFIGGSGESEVYTNGSVAYAKAFSDYIRWGPGGNIYRHFCKDQQVDSSWSAVRMKKYRTLPAVKYVASLLREHLQSYQGAISLPHLNAYLDEFAFRFDRRPAEKQPNHLFDRFMKLAVIPQVCDMRIQLANMRPEQPKRPDRVRYYSIQK